MESMPGHTVPAPWRPGHLRAAIAAMMLVALAADGMLQQGVASGALYVPVVALTVWLAGPRPTWVAGMAAVALTLAGFLISPTAPPLWKALANRGLVLFSILVTVALVLHYKRLIASRDRAESRAMRSEQQLRRIVEASPIGMLLVDLEGRIVRVNAEAERLFGHARDALIGRSVEMLVPEGEREARRSLREALQGESGTGRLAGGRERVGQHKDGRRLNLEVGLTRIESPDGDLLLASVLDVGDRKTLEKARTAQALARRLVEAEDAQRKRFARELHDTMGQALTTLKIDLDWLSPRLPAAQLALHQRVAAMDELATITARDLRRLCAELRPAILDDLGLLAAMRWQVFDFERRSGLRCAATLPDGDFGWDDACCTVAYRVLQESMTNVLRHADAGQVSVALWREPAGDAVLEVRDDGHGFDAETAPRPGALGLLGMRERAELQGGSLSVCGTPGQGTTVVLRLPCSPDLPAAQPHRVPRPPAGTLHAAQEPGR